MEFVEGWKGEWKGKENVFVRESYKGDKDVREKDGRQVALGKNEQC